jgi:hypothetical protein
MTGRIVRHLAVFVALVADVATLAGCHDAPGCAGEGKHARADKDGFQDCCVGLTRIAASAPVDDTGTGSVAAGLPPQCSVVAPDAGQECTQCGDGACGAGENRCNCPVDCEAPATDAFGQACPVGTGGVVALTYTVVHDGCWETVTEDRCRAWWAPLGGDDVLTAVVEDDGRCVSLSTWNRKRRLIDDPRVVSATPPEGCDTTGLPACAP